MNTNKPIGIAALALAIGCTALSLTGCGDGTTTKAEMVFNTRRQF